MMTLSSFKVSCSPGGFSPYYSRQAGLFPLAYYSHLFGRSLPKGIFEGIAHIEANAYRLLADLGASPVTEVVSAGGGAVNPKWTEIRSRNIGVSVRAAAHGGVGWGDNHTETLLGRWVLRVMLMNLGAAYGWPCVAGELRLTLDV